MKVRDNCFHVLSIIAFIASILTGFFQKQAVSIFMICAGLLLWLIWSTWELIALRKKVSEIQITENSIDDTTTTYEQLQEPIKITSDKSNCHKSNSTFMHWDKATLMIWVYITPKDEGIRNARNTYILAHCTNERMPYCNRFSMGYMGQDTSKKSWEVIVSNNKGDGKVLLEIKDSLLTGWHHFLVSWDKQKQEAHFCIDLEKSGNDIITNSNLFRSHWPEKIQPKVNIGSWMPEHKVHYCETEIANFMVTNQCLSIEDDKVIKHFKNKP